MKGPKNKASAPGAAPAAQADALAAKNLHDRIETWVNEGGAGDDDPVAAKSRPAPGAPTTIRPHTSPDR